MQLTISTFTAVCLATAATLPSLIAEEKKAALVLPAAAPADPMEILTGSADTWKLTPERFDKELGKVGAEWLEAGKTARIGYMVRRDTGKPHMIIGGKLPVYETVLNFADGALVRAQFSLYNRGDAGSVTTEKFKTMIETARAALTAQVGNAGQDRGKSTGAVLTKGWVWKSAETHYLLESSVKRQQGEDRPEFLRLIAVPVKAMPKLALGSSGTTDAGVASATLSSLKANVKKEENGDVYIANVPMVDQGQKGYCVVATAERVMRYYGAEVDQHEMAQMADSSAGGGTNPEKMTEALDKIDSKFKLRLKRIMPWTVRGYLDVIKDYNRAARSTKAEQIDEDESYNIAYAYQKMDADTLKRARATAAAMDKFKKLVRSSIDLGVPLMWSVHLGLYKEGDLPQSGGGHMRLIIGYNDTANQILFSDSWGPGHELKKIGADEAWSMTSGIYGMEPKAK